MCVQILPHPDFDVLIELCEQSFEVPNWWLPGSHDRDLLRGVAKSVLYTVITIEETTELCGELLTSTQYTSTVFSLSPSVERLFFLSKLY